MDYVGGGVDYNSGPYTVQFDAGVISASFSISINGDDIYEDSETFNISIDSSSLPKRVTVGDNDHSAVTILDNDGK